MSELYAGVRKSMQMACLAAFAVDPLNPSLSPAELRSLVLADGHSAPLFDEAYEVSNYNARARQGKPIQVDQQDLYMLTAREVPPQIPLVEADEVLKSLAALNRQQGAKAPKSVEALTSGGLSAGTVTRGLGLLLMFNLVKRVGDGFVGDAPNMASYIHGNPVRSEPLERMIDRVRSVFAEREGTSAPSTPPIQRFHLFLKRQGLESLAGWWAMTTQELHSLGDRHPTACTVLAASMLEAALVAIAEPAKSAGEWRKKDLLEPSERWKLGMLIDQAEVALTFSKNEAVLARTLADLRNRIHVGKSAVSGPERFKLQFTNPQDATIARNHLELLLVRILEWPPIAALA